MNAQIAQHLSIAEALIAEVQEWAHVLFVKFTTGRPRFVSKKVVKMVVSRKEAAEKIKSVLEADDREKYEARVWVTPDNEKVRVYVRDLGYTNAQDRGFVAILESGEIESHLLRNSRHAFDLAKDALKGFTVEEHKLLFQRSTQTEVEASLTRQQAHNYSSDEWHFGAADEESF